MPDATPLLALAGLILVKEVGIPVPLPGDLVVLGAGVAASRGDLDAAVALAALILASIVGGTAQFLLVRTVARPAILRGLSGLGAADRVERQTERLRGGGARGVAISRMTPGVRIVAIAASALAGLPAVAFLAGLVVGNSVFIAAHFGLGLVVGEPVLAAVGGALGPVAIIGLGLALAGLVAWAAIRRWRPAASFAGWADACCPACLTLALADR